MRDWTIEYQEGFALGALYAEADIRDHRNEEEELRADAREWAQTRAASAIGSSRAEHAFKLGVVRGYRDARARYDAGSLPWEMFDQDPVNR